MNWAELVRVVSASDRSSRRRLLGIAAGVMVGVALFLLVWSASDGIAARTLRSSWTILATQPSFDPTKPVDAGKTVAASSYDLYRGQTITVVTIAESASTPVPIPGVMHAPKPGEYVASPAAARLIESAPHDQLGDRYGHLVGLISSAGLQGPDDLLIVTGATVSQLVKTDQDAVVVTAFSGYSFSSDSYRIIAIIGSIAVLIPVLLLIAIITNLGSVQRAERLATLRLLGVTPRAVAALVALESVVTTLVGAMAGVGVYYAVLPLAARIPVGSGAFFYNDLLTSPLVIVVSVVITVFAATMIAWWRTIRADIGPLGTTRERHEARPRRISALPLALGLVTLGVSVWMSLNDVSVFGDLQELFFTIAFIGGFLLTALGLLLVGPLLTFSVAQRCAARARTASGVIAFNRIVRHPRSSFRAVSGLVIATYLVTVFSCGIAVVERSQLPVQGPGYLSSAALVAPLSTSVPETMERIEAVESRLARLPGVLSQVVVFSAPSHDSVVTAAGARALGFVSDPHSAYYSIRSGFANNESADPTGITLTPRQQLTPSMLVISTNTSDSTIERARTELITSGLRLSDFPATSSESAASVNQSVRNQYAALAFTGVLIAAALAAVSLAAALLAAVLERRRFFALLCLSGMPSRRILSVIALEAIFPIATVFVLSIGLGVFTVWALVNGISGGRLSIGWPGISYYVVLALCCALLGGAIAATLGAAQRMVREGAIQPT